MSADLSAEPNREVGAKGAETAGRVPRLQLIAYAALELPVMGAMNLMTLFLGFRYSELGVSLGSVAVIVMVARLLDVLIDPAVGFLSDRTRSRFGRRKVWVFAGTPVYQIGRAHV